ncbi:branched-chain amino acid ABC transporter permease [Salinigranum rubrum]|uniref:Branched-chain amino acid ABC transporter permease n=1 Tax=Salinigranum rubrum TaxID=755307 RepID=A0A2I8VJF7_9EURY|nr:branched-chain amino acid ABC transporter permease [Salinigranum rubrum]AUV81189.1 branched-chain amino acid ABC transporter permease [Salinigranum rubrum]
MSRETDPESDGGAVVDETTDSRSEDGFLERMSESDTMSLVGFAAMILVFPLLLVNGLGIVGDIIDLRIGGYVGLPDLVLIFGIAVIGFNLLLGYTELLSFGHAAFFGSAAYAAALFSGVVDSPILMVGVGTLVAIVIAWPIGFVSIRRSGVYFAVLTLTFGQMLYFYALGPGSWLTNGDNGYSDISVGHLLTVFELDEAIVGLDLFEAYTWQYVFVALCAIFALWFGYRIINSPYGLIFKALGENEERVSFVGLNVFRYKHMAFIISAGYAGAAGALFVIHETYIHPTTGLFWITSGDFVIMTVLGGTGSLIGPVFGALIFEYVSNVISGVSLPVIGSIGSLWRIVLGAVFVAVVWVFPQGVWGAIWDGIRWVTNLGGGGSSSGGEDR